MRRVILLLACILAGAPRAGLAAQDLLDGTAVLELTLSAPFDDLFAHLDDDDYDVPGQITYRDPLAGREVTVTGVRVAVRGNTSRRTSECDFPKLKLTFADTAREGTAIAPLQALKLGTHCGDRPDDDLTTKYGRLANERAPHREVMVYQMLRAAGVPTLRVRPARITYSYADGRAPLVRNALLLEDDSDALRRFEATGSIDEARFASARESFEPAQSATLAFAQALVGNFDWCLRFFQGDIYRCDERHPLWNVLALTRPHRPVLPVIYDFDLSGPVVGRHIWFGQVFDTSFAPSGSPIDVEVLAQVQRTRSLFSRELLDATRRDFVSARDAVYKAIDDAAADADGKQLARQYADSFYGVVQDDRRFYMPVVVDPGHEAFVDAERTQLACGGDSIVPVGTPAGEPMEERNGLVRVRLLDALWQWTGALRCDAIHREPIWIPAASLGTGYPR
jgi:hypothetical protein